MLTTLDGFSILIYKYRLEKVIRNYLFYDLRPFLENQLYLKYLFNDWDSWVRSSYFITSEF